MRREFDKEAFRTYLNEDGIREEFEEDYKPYDLVMLDINGFNINDPLLKIKSQFQPYNEYRWVDIKQIEQHNLTLKKPENMERISVKGTFGTYINVEEIENIHPQEKKWKWPVNELIECFLEEKKTPLYHNANCGPFFDNIYLGLIHLPPREQYEVNQRYYKSVFNELAHAAMPIEKREKNTEKNNIEKYRRIIIAELASVAALANFGGKDSYRESSILLIDYYKNRPEYKNVFKNDQELILERADKIYNLIISPEPIELSYKINNQNKNDSFKRISPK